MTDWVRYKKFWLISSLFLVLMMISVGGITRLTRSGLSIAEWRPVTGIVYPHGDDQWNEQFELYKQTPEYNQINNHFSIDDYKKIFFWEYFHRLLGRLIFFWILVPGLILAKSKVVSYRAVVGLSSLVIGQGFLGWVMVQSGMQNVPRVSSFFLAGHFFLAVFLMTVLYFHLSKLRPRYVIQFPFSFKLSFAFLGLCLLIQVFYGCLNSGGRVGLIYSSYPKMAGQWIPDSILGLNSILDNLFFNPALLQWVHRWLGVLLLVLIGYHYRKICSLEQGAMLKRPMIHFIGITTMQVLLGIINLVYFVPLMAAVSHQASAALIVLAYFNIIFRTLI